MVLHRLGVVYNSDRSGMAIQAGTQLGPFEILSLLGAVLYEMVTGRPAFSGKTRAGLIASILAVEPPAMTDLQSMVPPVLDRVVRTCLAKDPDERWQTAHDLKLQLQRVMAAGGAVSAEVSQRLGGRRSAASDRRR